MKRVIRSSTDTKFKLPHLDQVIEEAQQGEFFDKCDFQYSFEDDGVDGTVLIWLADYNEYIGSSEYYEYTFVHDLFEKFNEAVRLDTGSKYFDFEPYNAVEFCGRADVIWVYR